MALLTMLAGSLRGADRSDDHHWNDRFRYDSASEKYLPNQLSLDLFGTYTTRDRFGTRADNYGGGVGLNYFLTRYVGIGVDSYLEEGRWPYRVNGSAIFRIPLGATGLAPYALGGGGREFKYVSQYSWHAGGGLEFRLNSHTGIFGDGRRVFPDKTGDYALWRAGIRISF